MATDDRSRSQPLTPYMWRLATIAVLMLVAAAGYALAYFMLVDTSAPCPPGPGLLGITRQGAGLLGLVILAALPLGVLFLTYAQERARPKRASRGLRVTREGPSAWMVQAATAASLAPWSAAAGFIVAGIASGWLGDWYIWSALLGLLAALCVAIPSALIACRLLFALHARRCARIVDPAPRERCPECGVDYESARTAFPFTCRQWRGISRVFAAAIAVVIVVLMTFASVHTVSPNQPGQTPHSYRHTSLGWPITWVVFATNTVEQSAIDDPSSGWTAYRASPPRVTLIEFGWLVVDIDRGRPCSSASASSMQVYVPHFIGVIALMWMFVAVVGLSCDAVMGYIAGRRLLRGGCPSCGYPVQASAPPQGHG